MTFTQVPSDERLTQLSLAMAQQACAFTFPSREVVAVVHRKRIDRPNGKIDLVVAVTLRAAKEDTPQKIQAQCRLRPDTVERDGVTPVFVRLTGKSVQDHPAYKARVGIPVLCMLRHPVHGTNWDALEFVPLA